MGIQRQQCSVATHTVGFNFVQACDGTEVIYFQDITDNHNKVLVQVFSTTTSEDCQMELVINGTTSFIIPTAVVGNSGYFAVQVEDVKTVGIRCTCITGTCGNCSGFVAIQKTFCICCP